MLVEGLTFLRERFKQRLSSDPKETKALERDTTLLTGAMGFLGAFLLRALARALRLPVDSGRVKASHRIICLVRAKSDRDALVRVQKALKYYRIILPENASIILGIAGDLEKTPLGFSEEKYVEYFSLWSSRYICISICHVKGEQCWRNSKNHRARTSCTRAYFRTD